MSSVNGDPEEMKLFAYHLNKFAMDLRGLKDVTKVKMAHLNQSWKDNENAQYVVKYEQAIKPMDNLIQTLEAHSAFLKKKASILEAFQNTKLHS